MMLAQSELPQLTTIGLRKNRLVRIQYVNFPRLKKILVEGNELDESTMNHLMVRMMVSERWISDLIWIRSTESSAMKHLLVNLFDNSLYYFLKIAGIMRGDSFDNCGM